MVRGFAEDGPEAREAVAALGIGIGIGRERCRVLGIGDCPGTLVRLEEIGHGSKVGRDFSPGRDRPHPLFRSQPSHVS
jgi:hypothetical protein